MKRVIELRVLKRPEETCKRKEGHEEFDGGQPLNQMTNSEYFFGILDAENENHLGEEPVDKLAGEHSPV
jgi:hypothetical protein